MAGIEATTTKREVREQDLSQQTDYSALSIVVGCNHEAGVAPCNGTVAVIATSRVVGPQEAKSDPAYA